MMISPISADPGQRHFRCAASNASATSFRPGTSACKPAVRELTDLSRKLPYAMARDQRFRHRQPVVPEDIEAAGEDQPCGECLSPIWDTISPGAKECGPLLAKRVAI